MTETEKAVAKFVNGLGGTRYREIFDLLESNQLHPLGKSNTETLLFQQRGLGGNALDVLAFRLKPQPVISFPKSCWSSRGAHLAEILSDFSYSERPPTEGPVSDSQYSAGQIVMNLQTHERIAAACRKICEALI